MIGFRRKSAGPRRRAIQEKRLIEMQTKRFSVFNHVLGMTESLAITPRAFKAFVAVSEARGHKDLAEEFRWSSLLKSFRETQRNNDSDTANWEVAVVDPDGVLRNKNIKAIIGPDDDGEYCVTFMLPDEVFCCEGGPHPSE